MAQLFIDLLDDESGATAVEYSLIVAMVSIAGISAFQAFGDSVADVYSSLSADLRGAADGIADPNRLARAGQALDQGDCRQLASSTFAQKCRVFGSR